MLLRSILDYPLPENTKEANKYIREIIRNAASKMHHTGNVSKKSYMNNKLIDLYLEDPVKFKSIIEQFRKGFVWKTWTGIIALMTFLVILLINLFFFLTAMLDKYFSNLSQSTPKSSKLDSIKWGVAPKYDMGLTVPINVNEGTSISSPFLIPQAFKVMCIASVQLITAIAYFALVILRM